MFSLANVDDTLSKLVYLSLLTLFQVPSVGVGKQDLTSSIADHFRLCVRACVCIPPIFFPLPSQNHLRDQLKVCTTAFVFLFSCSLHAKWRISMSSVGRSTSAEEVTWQPLCSTLESEQSWTISLESQDCINNKGVWLVLPFFISLHHHEKTLS